MPKPIQPPRLQALDPQPKTPKRGGRKRKRARHLLAVIQRQIPGLFEITEDSERVADDLCCARLDVIDRALGNLYRLVRKPPCPATTAQPFLMRRDAA